MVISISLATALRDAGLAWAPAPGDCFAVPGRDLDDEVFWIAEMTIEVRQQHGQPIVMFNGTTEWALDWIPASVALWLPREDQLRRALGAAFVALEHQDQEWVVTYQRADRLHRSRAADPESSYAAALLDTLHPEAFG